MTLTISKRSFLLVTLCLLTAINTSLIRTDETSCCDDNVVNVNGFGKVSVQPDIAIVSIAASSTAKITQEATTKVAQQINKILSILKTNNIPTQDIKTESISISPQYEYPNGAVKLVGQTAKQQLTVTVRKIDNNGGCLGKIIDQLVVVDGIQFNGLRFDKENKSEAERQARKMAFQDAKKKAQEYAVLSERGLGKVLAINDSSFSDAVPVVQNGNALTLKSSAGSSVPVGEQEVSYSINVKFALR